MNSKGSFAAIVAVSLIVLISAIGFTYYANGLSQKALLETQDALELRQYFTQVRFLLDKAAAKAFFDSADASCNLGTPNVSAAFDSVLISTNGSFICEISGLPASFSNNSEFSFTLTCSKAGISYSIPIIFKKELRTGATACEVWDIQGNPAFQDI